MSPKLAAGIMLAVVSGVMNGTFTLPMRYLDRWQWENVWFLFILVSCVVMPLGIGLTTVSHLGQALVQAPPHAVEVALATGFAWGFGAIMFGQGVSALGISMGNTLVLAISASLGSFLPILILAPGRLLQAQGKAIILGAIIGILGIAVCGYAGAQRERIQRSGERRMVGLARPYWAGLLLCSGSGLLSAVFNIGYSGAQPVVRSAMQFGNSAFAGSNVVWLLMLGGGAVANLAFCGYLFRRNHSWANYLKPKNISLYNLTILMGLLWGGNIFVYGMAAPKLGRLGPAIGWPLSLMTGLLTANACGMFTGEWKNTGPSARRPMAIGISVLLVAIAVLGWSGTLG